MMHFQIKPTIKNWLPFLLLLLTSTGCNSSYRVSPAWSPDGKQIAFIKLVGSSSKNSIDVLNTQTLQKTQLTTNLSLEGGEELVWSPDAKKIAVAISQIGAKRRL